MLEIESAADRAALFYDSSDIALFAQVDDAIDDDGATSIVVERNVQCIFDRAYRLVGKSEAYHPIALCLDEDVAYIKQSHRLMLKGHVWEVDHRQPDGTGFTQLVLKIIGRYRYDETDLNVQNGFPYTLPMVFGGTRELPQDDPGADSENPRLAYPYTVKTYLDWGNGTVRL